MNNKFKKIIQVSGVTFICFLTGFLLVQAQVWNNPDNSPPVLNPGQPPGFGTFDNLVRKSVTEVQVVIGSVLVEPTEGNNIKAYFGGDGDSSHKYGIRAQDFDPILGYPSENIGVYGHSLSGVGAWGEAGVTSSPEPDVKAGVAGAFLGESGYAARFLGPIQINDRSNPGASEAALSIDGQLKINGMIMCDVSWCDLESSEENYWLKAEHSGGGTALKAESSGFPGILLFPVSNNSEANSAAVLISSGSYPALVGSGADIGINGEISSNGNIEGVMFTGVGGFALEQFSAGGALTKVGIYGKSTGGIHNEVAYTIGSEYDYASGMRACNKDSAGAIQNLIGIEALAGEYAGYFDGELFIDRKPEGLPEFDDEVAFILGNTSVNVRQLRGLTCLANNILLGDCHTL